MQQRVIHWFLVMGLLVGGVFLVGAAPATPTSATGAEEERPFFSSGSGTTTAGAVVTTGSTARPVPAVAGVPRDVPRGDAVTPAEYAALKERAVRGEFHAPRADDLDAAVSGPSAAPAAPTLSQSFDTIPYSGWNPSDGGIAVGPSDLVVAANEEFSTYDKLGNLTSNQQFVNWFLPVLPPNSSGISIYDPWTFYDADDGRFVLVALGKRTSPKYSRWLVAVSDDNTAAGNWCVWATSARHDGSTQTDNWGDRDRAAHTSNALMLTANMFAFSNGSFQYAKVRYLPKSELYDTSCPGFTYQDDWNMTNSSTGATSIDVVPTLNFPGGTTNGHLVNAVSDKGGSGIVLWQTDTTGCCGTAPTLTRQGQITTAAYTMPPNAQQKGSTTLIDTGNTQLQDAVFRDKSGIWTAQTTGCNPGGDPTTRSCVRWYLLDVSGMSVTQSGTYGAKGFYYYYPAIHADDSANATVVFNRSSSSEFVGTRYTGKLSTETALEGSANVQSGQGCYVRLDRQGRDRWGDYNGIAVDTANSHMWLLSDYAFGTNATCGNNVWQMRAAEVHW
jgi:hypothetical protein